jgi:hypothetical protein
VEWLAELDRESNPLEKVLETVISYEQVLLSQISYCAKLTHLISYNYGYGDDVAYESDNIFSLSVCIDNLISLLPKDLRMKFFNKEKEIIRKIKSYVKNYECLKNDSCKDDELEKIKISINVKLSDELPEYSHLTKYIVEYFITEEESKLISVKYKQFQFALIIDVLMEEGIIGLKQSSLFVGRVDVPK